MEVNGVGNNLFDVEGGGEVVNRNKKKKKRENSYITIKRGL
jgi:hypothetical protein